MKKPKAPKQSKNNYTPNKAKRRPDGGDPSPAKKFSVDCKPSMSYRPQGR